MSMFEFLTKFKKEVPTFSKTDIDRAIAKINEDNARYTIPAYNAAIDLLAKTKYKSEEVIDLEANYHQYIKKQQGGIIASTLQVLNNIPELMSTVQKLCNDIFQTEEITDGLTFKKTVLLQVIEAAAFSLHYARRLLIYIYWFESNKTADGMKLVPNEIKAVEENIVYFAKAAVVLGMPPATLTKKYEQTVDAALTEFTETNFRGIYDHTTVDPLTIAGFNAGKLPTYMIGMYFFNKAIAAYDANKEEYEYLQLAVMRLKQERESNPSAQLDKEINNKRERMERAWNAMKKFEGQ